MSESPSPREQFQTWLRQCTALAQAQALSPHGRRVVDFAIRWAPFGGASPADLMENFGVTPARFRQVLRESLDPRGTPDIHLRAMKYDLSESLLRAWTPEPRRNRTGSGRRRADQGIKIKNLG